MPSRRLGIGDPDGPAGRSTVGTAELDEQGPLQFVRGPRQTPWPRGEAPAPLEASGPQDRTATRSTCGGGIAWVRARFGCWAGRYASLVHLSTWGKAPFGRVTARRTARPQAGDLGVTGAGRQSGDPQPPGPRGAGSSPPWHGALDRPARGLPLADFRTRCSVS